MHRALSSAVVGALLAGILVGGVLVYATPAIIEDLATTKTVTEVSTSTSTLTQPANTITQTQTQVMQTTIIQQTVTTTTLAATVTVATNVVTTTQFGSEGVNDVVQSCGAFGNPSQTVSCFLANPVKAGRLLVVEIAEVPVFQTVTGTMTSSSSTTTVTQTQSESPGPSLSDSQGDNFTQVGQPANEPGSTYNLYFFVANVSSSGTDQVTLTGSGNYPFLLVHELQSVSHVVGFSSESGDSASPSVPPYVAPSGSFVLASVFVLNNRGTMAASVGAGPGNALLDNTFGLSEEYNTAGGSTTSPFIMTASIPWGEASLAFS